MKENNEMNTLLTQLTNVINDLHTCLGGMRDIIARGVDSGACSAPTEKVKPDAVGPCTDCGTEIGVMYVVCPYQQDVNGVTVWLDLCPDCEHERAMDI